MPHPTSPLPATNLPQLNSNINNNTKTIASDLEDKLSLPPRSSRQSRASLSSPSSENNHAPYFQRRSAQLETKQTPDHYNWGRISTVKSNSSIPLGSLHSEATQMLYNYASS